MTCLRDAEDARDAAGEIAAAALIAELVFAAR
jgi:hypothetical protein